LIIKYLRKYLVVRPIWKAIVQAEMLREVLIILAIAAFAGAIEDFDPFIDIPFKRIKTSVGLKLC